MAPRSVELRRVDGKLNPAAVGLYLGADII
jgi:hypothetical protein